MPDTQTLTTQVSELNKSVDWWNSAMIWALVFAAIAAIAVVLTTRVALVRAKQLGDKQGELIRAKDAQLALDLRTKDEKISNLGITLATQQERAAIAEHSLLILQEKLRPRHLSSEQKKAISNALKAFPPQQVNIYAVVGTTDGTTFGLELAAAINSAGWTAKFLGVETSGGELRGIALVMKDTNHPPPGTQQLQDALKAAGLSAPMWNHPQWGGGSVIALFVAPQGI